jgi:hypothetical protein
MRSLIYAAALALVSTTAVAQPNPSPAPAAAGGAASTLPPLDASGIPAQCSGVATVPADAKIAIPALSAHVALATCGAEMRFNALKLTPDDASMKSLSDAAKASFDLLDQVVATNDPTYAAMAQKAHANILISMAVRMRNSIPPITMTTVGQALIDHDKAHADLEPKIKPWLDQAAQATQAGQAAPH